MNRKSLLLAALVMVSANAFAVEAERSADVRERAVEAHAADSLRSNLDRMNAQIADNTQLANGSSTIADLAKVSGVSVKRIDSPAADQHLQAALNANAPVLGDFNGSTHADLQAGSKSVADWATSQYAVIGKNSSSGNPKILFVRVSRGGFFSGDKTTLRQGELTADGSITNERDVPSAISSFSLNNLVSIDGDRLAFVKAGALSEAIPFAGGFSSTKSDSYVIVSSQDLSYEFDFRSSGGDMGRFIQGNTLFTVSISSYPRLGGDIIIGSRDITDRTRTTAFASLSISDQKISDASITNDGLVVSTKAADGSKTAVLVPLSTLSFQTR